MVLLTRPWRWLVAVLIATVLLGVVFQVGSMLGAPKYFGLPPIGRLALFALLVWVQSAFLIPSYEEMDRGEPLPPLPESVRRMAIDERRLQQGTPRTGQPSSPAASRAKSEEARSLTQQHQTGRS